MPTPALYPHIRITYIFVMTIKRSTLFMLLGIALTAIVGAIAFSSRDVFGFLTWQPVPIKTSIIREQPNLHKESPFRIIADKTNYAMKVIDATSATELMFIYVAAGEEFNTRLPVGRYRIKAIHGPVWYGTERLFGDDTHPIFLREERGTIPIYDYIDTKPCLEAPATVFDFTKGVGCSFKMLQGSQLGYQTGASFRDF
jgi:hypothetical protein